MDPITIALGLAQFAPSLLRYFNAGDKAASVAEKVIDIAKTVTGHDSPEEALKSIELDPNLQQTFRLEVLHTSAELDKAYLSDTQDARKRDTEMRKLGLHNVRADLLTLGAFVVIALICYKVWNTPDVPEWVKAVVMLVLGRFLGYMDQIFQFEFGATRAGNGSK